MKHTISPTKLLTNGVRLCSGTCHHFNGDNDEYDCELGGHELSLEGSGVCYFWAVEMSALLMEITRVEHPRFELMETREIPMCKWLSRRDELLNAVEFEVER